MDNIYDLWDRIKQHPDFAGGAIFIRDDVAHALFHEDDNEFATEEEIARITPEMMRQAKMTTESFIFFRSYAWDEAIRDIVDIA